MKICFVSREYPPSRRAGGLASYVWESAQWLSAHGHLVTVVAASDDVHQESVEEAPGLRVVRLRGGDFFLGSGTHADRLRSQVRRLFSYRGYRARVAECVQNLVDRGEVELVEFAEYGEEALVWAERQRTVPWIVRLHTPAVLDRRTGARQPWSTAPLIRLRSHSELATLRKADAISSCSGALARSVAALSGLDAAKVRMIPNAVDSAAWRQADSVAKPEAGPLTIFSAGAVVAEKGYGELVEAVRALRERGHDLELVLAGRLGKLGRSLGERSVHDPRYKGWLSLPGAMPRMELAARFAAANLVVFPSWWEAFGLVCVEAMASGALVLGSDRGGIPEIITDGHDGFLVRPRDSTALSEKISALLSLPRERSLAVRDAARSTARIRFDVAAVMSAQIAFYNETIAAYQAAIQSDGSTSSPATFGPGVT